jgi:hypothetical protein
MFTIWSTHETTAHKLNQWRSWRPPQPHLVTIWACNTTYYHDPSCMITPASLNRWIVFSSMHEAADRIDWRDMCTFIRCDGTANAFFLPHPLTSALPLLHRIRYCYSRATLETTWWSERHNRRAYVIGWRTCTFIRDDGLLRCIFCLILWLLSCLFFIVLYQVLLYHQLEACFASSSSYCIRYCYIRLEGMCTFIRNDGLLAFSCLLLWLLSCFSFIAAGIAIQELHW